ncbi:DUF4062 domain-containing protein [Novosphingobium sp. MMS21-SN21R]|uniref:DUF4062 domain-containing protein n=1 Tax=Novosphingobium sp. MMS21-SN21R TaxID=2969298 RepID=UPI002888A0E2|nr:DUF4062 domain-containing protein [Novosphingobium sp. MMS21-SN21R]MDT0507990.1 DUF4062 domain-containing protein [Novosphingobium sp. MMS21-SN21R]
MIVEISTCSKTVNSSHLESSMAKPRVFLSSTYYDLRSLRGELERFIREKGYEPILNERGHITYSKENSPEVACYREIESCDILVSVIGGRFGSTSNDGEFSVSQLELRTAIEQYKQVYIFVERDVSSEYRTYLKNKNTNINWTAVDNVKIYKFLEEVHALPNNNAIMSFETGQDIINLLREQWAGLFQRMLQSQASVGALETAQELRQGVDSARQLVELLRSPVQNSNDDEGKIDALLLPNHPSFSRIKRLLKVPYRVYFTSVDELNSWLKVRSYKPVLEGAWDNSTEMEWYNDKDDNNWDLLKINTKLFDGQNRFRPDSLEWSDSLIRKDIRPKDPAADDDNGDDLPF